MPADGACICAERDALLQCTGEVAPRKRIEGSSFKVQFKVSTNTGIGVGQHGYAECPHEQRKALPFPRNREEDAGTGTTAETERKDEETYTLPGALPRQRCPGLAQTFVKRPSLCTGAAQHAVAHYIQCVQEDDVRGCATEEPV